VADSSIPSLGALTGANSASADLTNVVDVSDTTAAAAGTDKKMTLAELATGLITHGSLATETYAKNAAGLWLASQPTGALGATGDRALVNGNNLSILSYGGLHLSSIVLPAGLTITNISFVSGSTALTGGTYQWFGIFTDALNIGRLTADATSAAWPANTAKTLALTSAYVTPYAGLYFLGASCTTGGGPTLTGYGYSALTHIGLSPVLSGLSSSGVTTPGSCPDPVGAPVVGHRAYAWVT